MRAERFAPTSTYTHPFGNRFLAGDRLFDRQPKEIVMLPPRELSHTQTNKQAKSQSQTNESQTSKRKRIVVGRAAWLIEPRVYTRAIKRLHGDCRQTITASPRAEACRALRHARCNGAESEKHLDRYTPSWRQLRPPKCGSQSCRRCLTSSGANALASLKASLLLAAAAETRLGTVPPSLGRSHCLLSARLVGWLIALSSPSPRLVLEESSALAFGSDYRVRIKRASWVVILDSSFFVSFSNCRAQKCKKALDGIHGGVAFTLCLDV